jgi:hypothetical protein
MKGLAALVSANPSSGSQRAQEVDEVLLFARRQLRAEYEIEEFNRIVEGQQAPVVQLRRRILDAAKRKGFDGPVG